MATHPGHLLLVQRRNSSPWQKRRAKLRTRSAGFEMLESRVLLNSEPVILDHVVFGRSDVKLEEEVELTFGVLGSDGKIQVEDGASINSVYAGGEIEIKKNAVVDGPILGGNDVKLDDNSQVVGGIDAGDDVKLEEFVTVAGDVTAAGDVNLKRGATVSGTITENGAPNSYMSVALPPINSIAFNPDQDITTTNGATTMLAPGAYGKLDLKKDNVLHLSTGEYFFESIKADDGLQLTFDVRAGEVAVLVAGPVEFETQLDPGIIGGSAADIYLETHDTFELKKESEWLGTVFAPYEQIELDENVSFVGAAYSGDKVTIKKNSTLELVAAARLGDSDEVPPLVTASLQNDTGSSPADGITFDPTVTGTVTDDNDVVALWLTIPEISATAFDVTGILHSVDGTFSLDRARIESLIGGPLTDGAYTYQLSASDEFDNISTPLEVLLILDTSTSVSTVELDPAFDSAPIGDLQTTFTTVTLVGTTEPDSVAELIETGDVTSADAAGNFAFANVELSLGANSFNTVTTDVAGNEATSSVTVTRLDDDGEPVVTILLDETGGFINETTYSVDLSPAEGSRTISFFLDAMFDTSDTAGIIEDTLLVYLVDPNDPSQTLLDRGENGTALFMLAGDQVEYAAGIVGFDGARVEIDVSGVSGVNEGLVVFQLVNIDSDNNTQIVLQNVSNTTSVVDEANNYAAPYRPVFDPAGALDFAALIASQNITAAIENVRADAATGRYIGEIRLRNDGPAVGRQLAAVFPGLPAGVTLLNASGISPAGDPYINMQNGIPRGGLDTRTFSDVVKVEFDNPVFTPFTIAPQFFDAGPNQAPTLAPMGPLLVMPGDHLKVQLAAADADGDALDFFIRSDQILPYSTLDSSGRLIFSPAPDQLGNYQFEVIASDGLLQTSQLVTLDVVADPVTTTRISGFVLNTDQEPLVGVPIELGTDQTTTAADGNFTLELPAGPTADALIIHGELLAGPDVYPYIAEKLQLLLGSDPFANVNNVIARPIYLPVLDVANGVTIDPSVDTTVTTPAIPGASVFVAANTLLDQQGNPFSGVLSITEVPPDLTPAALPPELFADLVVTIQPGEMVFTTPAPLSLPNRAGFAASEPLDLWSINPATGLFDNVGTGQVSADGTTIETISGGIRNSSWHFFSLFWPLPWFGNPYNLQKDCNDCEETNDPNDDNKPNGDEQSNSGNEQNNNGDKRNNSGAEPRLVDDVLAEPQRRSPPTPETAEPQNSTQQSDDSFFGDGNYNFATPPSANYPPVVHSPSPQPTQTFPKNGPDPSGGSRGFGPSIARTPLTAGSMPPPDTEVALHSGAFYKSHSLATYNSLGVTRGIVLHYDSERADPRPILHVGFENVQSNLPDVAMSAKLSIYGGDMNDPYSPPPAAIVGAGSGGVGIFRPSGKPAIETAEHFFTVGNSQTNADAAIQADMRLAPSGRYIYRSDARLGRSDSGQIAASSVITQSNFLHVNTTDSPFGSGWGIAGLQHVVENTDRSVLLVDGDGSELLFAEPAPGEPFYDSPPGDFSQLEKLPDGTFRRTLTDQTVYVFNANNDLALVSDRNGNQTQFIYNATNQFEKIIDPVGLETVFTYTGDRITKITDPALRESILAYDADGNLIQITDADTTQRQFEYDSRHHLTAETDKRGLREETVFDFAGRVNEVIRKDGSSIAYTPVQTQGLFRSDQTTSLAGAPRSPDLSREPVAQYVDANGNVTQSTLDSAGQRVSATDGNGPRPTVQRNDENLITRFTDARGNDTLFGYDDRGNIISVSDRISRGTSSQPLYPGIFFQVDTNAVQLAVADVNSDGLDDMVTANFSGDSISVLLGIGDGTFEFRTDYFANNPRSVKLADVNDDTKLDIVTARSVGQVAVLLGNGDGTFATPINYNAGDFPNFVEAIDVNDDDRIDLLTANRLGNTISVLLGNGDGTFADQVEYATALGPVALTVSDLNGDGNLDVVSANDRTTDNLSVLLGNGDGSFASHVNITIEGKSIESVVAADLDGDAIPDLLATGGLDTLAVLIGNGDGTFIDEVNYTYDGAGGTVSPPPTTRIATADFDVDGDVDVAVVQEGRDTVTVFANDGNGVLSVSDTPEVVAGPNSIAVGDFNLDGRLDLGVLGKGFNTLIALLGNGDGTFVGLPEVPPDVPVGNGPRSVIAVDVNQDGHDDVVTADVFADSLSVLLGAGDGTLGPRTVVPIGDGARFLAADDFNGDNITDLAVTSYLENTVAILIGNGDGTFGMPIKETVGAVPFNLTTGDVDNDGDADIVIASEQGASQNVGTYTVVFNNNDGTFTPVIRSAAYRPRSIALGDLNGDEILDLAIGNTYLQIGNRVQVRFGFGDGTFGSGANYGISGATAAAAPTDIDFADLDADGDLDIVATDLQTDSAHVLINTGNGILEPSVRYRMSSDPRSIGIGDLNLDGVLDIMTATSATDRVVVRLGNGDGTFAGRREFYVGDRPLGVALADLDDDGDLDFIAANRDSDSISVRLNTAATAPSTNPARLFHYDATFSRLTERIDELGNRVSMEIDPANGNTLSMTQVIADLGGADDIVTQYTYTPAGLVDTVTDPLGRITDNDYDAFGNLTLVTFAVGTADEASIAFEYDAAGNVTAMIDELGHRTELTYDNLNRVTHVTESDPDGPGPLISPTRDYTYDEYGNLLSVTDALNNSVSYTYDSQHRVLTKTDALDNSWTYTYDAAGNVTSMTDRIGRITRYRYDDRNRLIELVDPAGARERYRYDVDDNRVRVIDKNGETWQTIYDARDRAVIEIDALGQLTTLEYDRVDNLIASTDELGRRTELTYDDIYRLTQVTQPDPDQDGPDTSPVLQFTYDKANNLILQLDALGNATDYVYDERDRLTQTILSDPDGAGPLASPIWSFAYDDANRLIRQTDPLLRETSFQYDDLNRLLVETYPDPDGPAGPDPAPQMTYTYDVVHNERSMTDALGNTTFYDYDDLYRLTTVTTPDPDGAGPLASPVITYTYDNDSQLTSVSDPLARTTSYAYDALGRLIGETYPDPDGPGPDSSPVMIHTYDPVGNRTSMTDALGNITRYEYDTLYRLTKVIEADPDGAGGPAATPITTFSYDAADQLISVTDPLGRVTTFDYDQLGRTTTETRPDPDGPAGPDSTPVMTYVYDLMDNELSMTDALGNITQYEYDNLYRLTKVIQEDPDGTGPQVHPETSYSYDVASQMLSVVDPLGRTTSFEYDNLSRVTRATYPDPDGAGPLASPQMTYRYDLMDNELSMTDPLGNVTEYEYDNLYRLTSLIEADPDGAGPLSHPITRYTYDVASQLLTESDPLNRTNTYAYDNLGRLIEVVQPDPDGAGPLAAPTMSYTYDSMNNELSMTDPLGHVTQYEYDNLYRTTRQTEEDLDGPAGPLTNPVTTFSYDLVDNLLSLTDPLGNTTTYAYDDLDRLATETIELGPGNFVSRQLQYDLMDNLVRRTDRNDRVIEFAYDAIYRQVEERWLDAGGNVIHTIQHDFDEASQLLRAEDLTTGSRYDYTYDDLGRVTQSQVNNGGPTVIFSHVYDANSRRTDQFATVAGTADFHNIYVYDALNRVSRLDQVAQPGGNLVAPKRVDFGYNADDQFVSITRHKDTVGLPTDLVMQSNFGHDGIGRLTDLTYANASSTLVDFDWTFDSASRITQFVSSVDGASDYGYDNGDQLTAATHAAQSDEAYEYDEIGNRTSTGYTTGFYNRLTSDGTYNYEYDAEGNRTKRTNISTGAVTEYTWDHRNRLVTITDRTTDGGPVTQTVNHRYDVFNRWISNQVDPDGAGPQPAATTRYQYDGSQIVLELDDSGSVTHRYLWGPAVDQLLADEQATGDVIWPIIDHLGTVRDLVDTDGNVINHIVYDSFGNVISETNAAIDLLFGFTGRAFDDTTGLQNNLNRWYDAQTGRWLSEDPIGFAAGDPSLYRYVGNNPLTGLDPSGFVLRQTHAFSKGFNQGIRTGLGNFTGESISFAQGALDMANMIRYGTIAGAARIGESFTGKSFTMDDAALQIARDIKSNSRGIRAFENAASAIGQALSEFSLSDYADLARGIADAVGDAAQDWANEFERRMANGCYEQAGQMMGEVIGEMLPELLFGSKGLKHFCFAAGTQVVVVDEAVALAPTTRKLPQEDEATQTGWNQRYLAAAFGCGVVTVAGWLAARQIRRRTEEEGELTPTALTDEYFHRFGLG